MDIIVASPRGFCAGVDRAIETVEKAIDIYGTPIYVRHEIVHNKYVVETLKKKGAIFVPEISDVPKKSTVIFSAHGVAKNIHIQAKNKDLKVIDATCPLVTKVHLSVSKHHKQNRITILIGHKGHPEVDGTMGQIDKDIYLVQNPQEVEELSLDEDRELAFVTQTTLSISETKEVTDALKKKYPHIQGPEKGDLCYATTNRQLVVKELVQFCDILIVIGSKNSSNSTRLMEIGKQHSIPSYLIDNKNQLKKDWIEGKKKIGISSGASAPEILVEELIDHLKAHFPITSISEHTTTKENMKFNLPKELANQ